MARWLIIMVSVLAADAIADSSTRERAKQVFADAEAAFKLGRFEDALRFYEAAYEIDPHPDLLFNVAQCHRNLRHYDRAIFFLESYLRDAKEIDERDRIRALIEELEQARRSEPSVETRIVTTTISATSTVTLPVYVEVETPAYEQGWFWGLMVGVAVAAGAAIAIGVAASADSIPEGDYVRDLRR
jgi:tetratricopeptide (TPR) repeat protein